MNPPESFARRLRDESGGELRIRWSNARGEWHIEQRVGRAIIEPSPVSAMDDDHIRATDGYALVLAVRDGDRMPCPDCGCELPVPHLQFAEIKCDWCKMRGKDGRHIAGHFPLGDALLQHLRRLDPKRGWREGEAKRLDLRNQLITASRERAYSNHIEATTKDHYRDLVGIGQWGYNSPAHPKGH